VKNCYNSVDNPYNCEQTKINCLFANDVTRHYKSKRYGIKSCKKDLNEAELWDLKQLFDHILTMDLHSFDKNTFRNKLYLEDRLNELNGKGCISDFKILTLQVCNISDIVEKINSL